MKFSSVFVLASVLASETLIVGAHPLVGEASAGSLNQRQAEGKFNGATKRSFGGFGGFGGNKGGASGGNKFGFGNKGGAAGASSTTTTAAASTSTTASSGNGKGTGGAAAAGGNNNNNNGNLQTSLTLDPALIGANLAQDGQAVPEPGQVASLTSTNNFINFCASVNQPITNGLQQAGGSCNPVPMGQIPASTQVASSQFVFPTNGGTVKANQNFTISLAIQNLETGNFVNAKSNYYSAPAQLNAQGILKGHSHVVIQKLDSLVQTTPLQTSVFTFFKGLNDPAVNGVLTAVVSGGIPAGAYKLSSITTGSNHQAANGPVAQRGGLEDVVYFTSK